MWAIKDKTGQNIKCTVGALEYNGTWMGECYLTVTVESPIPIVFAIGDYIEYRGERFEINYDPSEIKSAPRGAKGDAFKYEQIKFNSLADELTRCDFLDYVKEDNQLHYTGLPTFSFFAASIQDLADRIQVNLDRLYTGDKRWLVRVNPEYVNKTDVNISVDKQKVWDALEFVTKNFGANFIIRGREITIGTAGIPTDELFKYGKNNGLASIKRQSESNQQIITRLRVYGSTDNMPTRYYNRLVDDKGDSFIPNNMAVNFLMLPDFPEKTQDPYIDSPNIEALGVREGSVFFDGSNSELEVVKPSIEGMTAEQLKAAGVPCNAEGALDEVVGAEQATDDGLWEDLLEGEEVPNFKIFVKDLGFDINDHLANETATISMKSGMLGGRDFTIVKCEKNENDGYTLTCQRVYDDSLRLYFPYSSYNIKAGDKFVLLHIEMPDVYIKAASQRLLTLGQEYLKKVDYSRSSYSPEIDEIFMARQHVEAMASGGSIRSLHDNIKEGDIMLFADEDLLLDNASVIIDNLQIKEGDEKVPTYKVTLRNEKSVGTIQRLQNQIDAIVSGGGQGSGGYTATQIRQMIFAFGKERFLSKIEPDVAQKVIRFLEGAEYGDYVKGFSGAGIDKHGNGEFESLESRSYLKVMELIYNRLNALEGNTSFADVGTIESIEQLPNSKAILTMRKRWDGDFTAFQYGDIIYGYVNNLATSGVYYKAWAWVDGVDRVNNTLTVNYYVDTEVPAQKNFPMTANMIVTRWGNVLAANAQSHGAYPSVISMQNGNYYNTRQSSFFISCEDGNIVQLLGVDRPILQRANYGTVLGQIPTGMLPKEVEAMLNPQQPYLYARGIIVQDLIRIGYDGLKTTELNYRGVWSLDTAKSPTDYYRNSYGLYDVVTWNNAMWQCIVTGNIDEPSEATGTWVNISGQHPEQKLSIWQIIPSANVIIVRPTLTMPNTLTAEVLIRGTDGEKTYKSTYELLQDDLKLLYSLDGINFTEFVIGNDEPLELEDETDVIELENATADNKLILSMGGDDIPASAFGDSVYFKLQEISSGKTVSSLIVPVVKDGYNGDWISYVFCKSDEKPATPQTTTKTIPDGWSDAPTSEGRWWMSKATIDGTTQLPKMKAGETTPWSDPVQVTAEDGGVYDFKYQKNTSDTNAPGLDKMSRNPGDDWTDQPPQLSKGEFLWMIVASIDSKDNLVGQWSDPVRISGESAFSLDLSNEMDGVLCDSDNNVVMPAETYPQTLISYYRGAVQLPINNLQIAVIADGKQSTTAIEYSVTDSGLDKAFKITKINSMPQKLEIVFAQDGHEAKMTINRDNGDCIYNLVPSVNQVKRYADGSYSVGQVGCGLKKTDRSGTRNVPALPTGYTLKYSTTSKAATSAPVSMSITGSIPTQGNSSITFYLYDASNTLIDKEVVSIVYDGEKGDPGDPGKDGNHTEFRYKDEPEGHTPIFTIYEKVNRTCAGGWKTEPPQISIDTALWMSQATIDSKDNLVGQWSDPVRISGRRGAVGEMGERGLMAYPAGVYDKYTVYETTDTSTPVVLDTITNQYYVLKPGKIWQTAGNERYDSPSEDYTKSGDEAKWQIMDRFNSIFANIIMAQFAKLASAVFYGDQMFSQQGTLTHKVEVRYKVAASGTAPSVDKTAKEPSGWTTTFPTSVSTGNAIWYITANKHADGTLLQGNQWSTPATTTEEVIRKDVVTANSTKYQEMQYGCFSPNLFLNFLTGTLRCRTAEITGTINATKGQIGSLLIQGNDLVGFVDGSEVVRLGVGNVTDVTSAFETKAIPFDMDGDRDTTTEVTQNQWGYYNGYAKSQGEWFENREDGNITEHTSLGCTVKFTLTETATKVLFGRFDAGYTTHQGTFNGKAEGSAILYRVSGSKRSEVARWGLTDIDSDHEVSSLQAGKYEVSITTWVSGSFSDWVGDIEFYVGGIFVTTGATTGGKMEIARDGFLCYQGSDKYMFFSKTKGFECQHGGSGLKISSSGLQKLVNGDWQPL